MGNRSMDGFELDRSGEVVRLECLKVLVASGSDAEQEEEQATHIKKALMSFSCPARVRDWSELPRDISDLIGDKMQFLPHLQKFGTACKEWRDIAYERIKIVSNKVKNEPPMLMLPYNPETQIATFLELKNSRRYELKMPQLQGQWICSVSHGWLAMIDINFDLFLFNPLTQTRIQLPPQHPYVITNYYKRVKRMKRKDEYDVDVSKIYAPEFIVSRVVLSGDPSSTDCVIAIIYSDFAMLAVCRLGDESWTVEVPRLEWRGFDDIIFYGGNIFTAGESIVYVYEYSKQGGLSCPKKIQQPFEDPQLFMLEKKLVESCGDLFHIIGYAKWSIDELDDSSNKRRLFSFDVYKFEPDKKEGAPWSKVHNLGNRSLFLGSNDGICVSVKEFPWCKPNCIYFTDVYGYDGFEHNNGVYSMEERRVISRFDIQHSTPVWPSPAIWFRV